MSYQELLKHPFWQKKRLEIFARDKWACVRCSDTMYNLQVHHLYYKPNSLPWEYPDDALITVCELCHRKEEFYKWIEKHCIILRNCRFTDLDIYSVLELVKRRVKENHNHQTTIEYMESIKKLILHV